MSTNMSSSRYSQNKSVFKLHIERDSVTKQYPLKITHNFHTYMYICDDEYHPQDCYYIRDDGIGCRYYYNQGCDGVMTQIELKTSPSGHRYLENGSQKYFISDMLVKFFLPNVAEESYKITA